MRLMEEHQVLTRLVPIERKIIITNVVKYLLAGKANGDYFNEEMLECNSFRRYTTFIYWGE